MSRHREIKADAIKENSTCRIGQKSTNGTTISSQYSTFTANTRIIDNMQWQSTKSQQNSVSCSIHENGRLVLHEFVSQVEPNQTETVALDCFTVGPQTRDSPDQTLSNRRETKKSDHDWSSLDLRLTSLTLRRIVRHTELSRPRDL